MVAALAATPRWIIEGVYGWLAAVALPRAAALVWLDLPWTACRDGLAARGRWDGATDEEHAALLPMGRGLLAADHADLVRRPSRFVRELCRPQA
jgi:hypothetical protein